MIKRGIYPILFLLLCSIVFGHVSAQLSLGEQKAIYTPQNNYTVMFIDYDPFSEQATFRVNGQDMQMLAFQAKPLLFGTFFFSDLKGESKDTLSASFFIDDIKPYHCERTCENNTFVDVVRLFDSDFELCKQDCAGSCELFHQRVCIENDVWITNNCDQKLEKLETCTGSCTQGYCRKPVCTDCTPSLQCVSDQDCRQGQHCVHGSCSRNDHIRGDGICSLPSEDCSSVDCSCDNDAQSKGRDESPIVIFHGFASSPHRIRPLQRALARDLDYVNAGEVSHVECFNNDPQAVYVASFYEDRQDQIKGKQLSIVMQAAFSTIRDEEETGDNYIEIFGEVIDKVKSCTGSEKVNIIAHSMSGMVTRNYLLTDDNVKNVNKVILLGSPNHGGIYGSQTYKLFEGLEAELGDRKELLRSCSSFEIPSVVLTLIDGRDVTGECEQLQRSQSISHPILNIDETPGLVEYYVVAGEIDGLGDGVVPVESTFLNGTVFNTIVPCDHFDLKSPSRCKGGYLAILNALGYEEIADQSFTDHVKNFFLTIRDLLP